MATLAVGLAGAAPVVAAPAGARLISPPQFGEVREVTGSTLLVVRPGHPCAAADIVGPDRICLAGIRPQPGEKVAVLVAGAAPAGMRIGGQLGRDFQVYDVALGDRGLVATRRTLPTSQVMVPRGCFALRDEPVGYLIQPGGGPPRAIESQLVSCGGGPAEPRGPYRLGGPPMPSDPRGWRATETTYIAGAARYLAVPDAACPQEFRIREMHCARSGISYLKANPAVPEVDLIAVKAPVRGDEVLPREGIMQWVLKRRSEGFKADSRWFSKSMYSPVAECTALESVMWHVAAVPDGFQISEQALSQCGAPFAPVPTAIYEIEGNDSFILNCRWDDNPTRADPACKSQAIDYLRRAGRDVGYFVIINDRYREGDRLFPGSYIRYSVLRGALRQNDIDLHRDTPPAMGGSQGCTATGRGAEADGFVVARAGGILWARRTMRVACPVY
ncbi:MAG: hypothetical protein JSS36_03640 [Proteobacteria bacterium]|nr:hypothetical protein [Pseudomonadota bacterium]